jgi:hypothetical protein
LSVPGDQALPQAPTVRVPKRFPLVARPGFRSTTIALTDPTVRSPVSDAALFNCYAELDPEDNQYWVEKRLGTSTLATASGNAGGIGVGYTSAASYPFVIIGSTLYIWQGGVLTPVPYGGSRPLVTGRLAKFVNLPFNNVAASFMAWAVNGSLWIIQIPFVYLNVADQASIPWTVPLCDGCVYLDGVLYVMDQSGNIWGSASNNVSSWPATTVIQAGGRYDIPVALAQQLEYIIAFKSTSLRCFYNAGAAAQTSGVGSNLAWVEGADANFGCANAGSIQLIDQTIVWVTSNDSNTPQIARMDGLQVKIISTPPVERLLQTIKMGKFSAAPSANTNILYSNSIKRGGHRFYTLTVPSSAANKTPFTLAYDLDQELWYLWSSPGLTYWSVVGASAHADLDTGGSGTTPGLYAQDATSGAFYVIDTDQVYSTDSGAPCQVDIYTPGADMGTRRKKQLNAMYWVNDQVSGSYMQVRKSDDDYRSWSPFRNVSLNVVQPSLTRCGSFRRRALNIRHSAATPFRIKASDLQLDLGVL